jgi:redox-sensitive bicupin YhaK (pirin superfamily)
VIRIRRSEERGLARHGWLESRFSFSFADYHDPRLMGFRALRAINEDRVQPGQGFGAHSHRDMEILTWVLEGALEHADSLGSRSVIRPGELQRMSAGTGVTHSEYNASRTQPVHFLQIWILPDRERLEPSYQQREFPRQDRRDRLQLAASRDGRDGSLQVHQDAELYLAELAPGARVQHRLRSDRHAWVQIARGSALLGGATLDAGDGAAISEQTQLELVGKAASELLLFDLA